LDRSIRADRNQGLLRGSKGAGKALDPATAEEGDDVEETADEAVAEESDETPAATTTEPAAESEAAPSETEESNEAAAS